MDSMYYQLVTILNETYRYCSSFQPPNPHVTSVAPFTIATVGVFQIYPHLHTHAQYPPSYVIYEYRENTRISKIHNSAAKLKELVEIF